MHNTERPPKHLSGVSHTQSDKPTGTARAKHRCFHHHRTSINLIRKGINRIQIQIGIFTRIEARWIIDRQFSHSDAVDMGCARIDALSPTYSIQPKSADGDQQPDCIVCHIKLPLLRFVQFQKLTRPEQATCIDPRQQTPVQSVVAAVPQIACEHGANAKSIADQALPMV
jgi:hypothetical protein